MTRPQQQRLRSAAYNQALFRSVNERMATLNEVFQEFTPYGSWMCECFRTDCVEMIEMTLAEYEELRSHPERFAVVGHPSHVDADAEEIVERGERYWTIEKTGVESAVVRALDERAA